jgi:hypothetical protein
LRIEREQFLHALEGVRPGLSVGALLEQSNSFVFLDGKVMTYNEEIFCSAPSGLSDPEFNCAITAKSLLKILDRMPEDELEVSIKGNELVFKGKGREFGMTMDKEILLPIEGVDQPEGKWRRLDDAYCEGLMMVQECAGNDVEKFMTTCVHIHPEWVEAFDNQQIMRYKIDTRIQDACLVKKSSVGYIAKMEPTKMNETGGWLHFKNPSGLTMSCRRFLGENYADLGSELEPEGKPIVLPKSLAEASKRAETFSSEDAEANFVTLTVKAGRLKLRGQGASGRITEVMKAKYEGPNMSFDIAPKLLQQVVSRYSKALLDEKRLFVTGEGWVYVTFLRDPKAKE